MVDAPKRYERLVFTCDWYRVDDTKTDLYVNPSAIHVDWLHALYGPLLGEILQLQPEKMHGAEALLPFNRSNFFLDTRLPFSTPGWAASFEGGEEYVAYLTERLRGEERTLFVGFEMSPLIIRALTAAGVDYVDLTVHAIRFLPDYVFGVRSNVPRIARRVAEMAIPFANLRAHARISAGRSARVYRARALKPGSVVFLGQQSVDSSLISNGRMWTLPEIVQEIQKLAIQFPAVHYKFHPHFKDRKSVEDALKGVPRLTFIDANIYELLAAPEPAMFCAVSSGTLREAHVFGRATLRLSAAPCLHAVDARQLEEADLAWQYLPVGHAVLREEFWRDALLGEPSDLPREVPLPVESMKFMLNMKWGR